MAILFVVMIVLCIRTTTLPGGAEGIAFYLIPDFSRMFEGGIATFGEAVYAAMGQAFFSLSLGIAAMEIFGSYINKDRRLMSEAVSVTALNTVVAILAGLIIFPACFAYGVTPDSGPSLVFVTLPLVFAQMPLGNLWGALFFIFMSFAALSTVIAVFENLISFSMDKWEISRRRAVAINGILVLVLSLPCALGFNVLSGVTIPAIGDIQSIEDFIVSNNMLPLGALVFVLFCTRRYGWGWDNFLKEADTGIGIKFPAWSRIWVSYGIPVLIVIIFIMGYAPKLAPLARTQLGQRIKSLSTQTGFGSSRTPFIIALKEVSLKPAHVYRRAQEAQAQPEQAPRGLKKQNSHPNCNFFAIADCRMTPKPQIKAQSPGGQPPEQSISPHKGA